MSDAETATEAAIVAAGKTAARVTPAHIDNIITGETFYQPAGTSLTICVLALRNGFSVTGESAAASVENFDKRIGENIARENARSKIWMLEGYLLREKLCNGSHLQQAVYSFAAWLTTRQATLTAGASHDAAPMAEAVSAFLDESPFYKG